MAALMISSQLLLTTFVVYWLVGQYREEKTQLHIQLRSDYLTVQDQLVDSLLMEHLVIPALPGPDTAIIRVMEHTGRPSEDIRLGAVHWDGTARIDSVRDSIQMTSVITSEERMVRSIRLFINQNPSAFHSDTGVYVYAMELDSCSLLLNMEHALEGRGWTFMLDWPEGDPPEKDLAKMHGILLNGGPANSLPSLQVVHFNAYLIRSILPQILFALVLLLLSASAMWFAYRSLVRQVALHRLRDDFISNISHELKTPVSTVKIALEALQTFDRQKDPGVTNDYLNMAASELERLERLVEKVLHHQMLNNPSLVLDRESCDLGELARTVVRTMEEPIRRTGARVSVLDEDGPCSLQADRVYLEGVILNLLDNSLKYSGPDPEILIKIECNPSGTRLSVSDHGPGIPEEYRHQVFEKFFRIPDGNRHDVKGYGLGLNFASQVMARHGGSISFSNLTEGGCCFSLHFPPTKP